MPARENLNAPGSGKPSLPPSSPFAAMVDPQRVHAAAERAARLDLPRRRSTPWAVRDEDETDDDDDSLPYLQRVPQWR